MISLALVRDLVVMIFLAGCAWLDVRTRQVPNRLTLPALGGALIAAALQGLWPAALLVPVLILISGLPKPAGSLLALAGLGLAAAVSWYPTGAPGAAVTAAGLVTLVWLLWRHGLTGGADAKILMALVLLYGGGAFLAAVLTGGVFGLAGRVLKKRTLPYILPVAVGTIGFLIVRLITNS